MLQGSVQWDGTHVATSLVMLALLCAMSSFRPFPGAAYEVRGNGEMFPLNGPSWSLFFEYIGNLLYALVLRRLSTRVLTGVVVALGVSLAAFATFDVSGYGNIGWGGRSTRSISWVGCCACSSPSRWGCCSPDGSNRCGFAALLDLLAHFAGAVSCTLSARKRAICLNGVFETLCIVVVFPLLIVLGASGATTDAFRPGVQVPGRHLYPLYITHYAFMYLFYAWLIEKGYFTFGETLAGGPVRVCVERGGGLPLPETV